MELQRLRRSIAQLQDELGRIKRSRDWYRYRYQWAVAYFQDHGIPMPWGCQPLTANQDDELVSTSDEEIEPPVEIIKRRIIQNLIANAECAPQARHFSHELLAFSFIVNMYSLNGYRFIRELLCLPSELTIRRRYRASVLQIQEDLADVTRIPTIVADYIRQYDPFPDCLYCTICVDAFTVDPNRPTMKRIVSPESHSVIDQSTTAEQEYSRDNSFFLVQLTPWDRTFKLTPVHLFSAHTGTASPQIRQVIDAAIDSLISADPRIKIAFISVDGDEGYGANFTTCFTKIKACVAHAVLTQRPLVEGLISLCPFWISDWLHLMKNARTRLFTCQVCINPLLKSQGTSMAELRRYFGQSPTFTDSTSLGKMRDTYPLDLFTLARAFQLRENNAIDDTFIYILVFGLWVEAIENRHFDVELRATIIETLLLFWSVQDSLMALSPLREKAGRYERHVTFASRAKLRRFICTLAAQLLALRSGNSNLGLDRIGSHTEENYIGNIRSICHGDNRAKTVRRQVSRFELSRRLLSELSIERHIAKRVNLGGVALKIKSDVQFSLDGNPSDFAMELLYAAKIPLHEVSQLNRERVLPLDPESYIHRGFIEQIFILIQQAPLPKNLTRVRTSTQGCQIINRFHVFAGAKDEMSESDDDEQDPEHLASDSHPLPTRIWKLAEIETLKDLIVKNQATIKALREHFPGRSDWSLRWKRNAIAEELSAQSRSIQ
jgi:hypothetical protein